MAASFTLRANHHNKALSVVGLFSLLLLIQNGSAFEFIVGGANGWTVPSDQNEPNYNEWAAKSRFQIGDTLVFAYKANEDSVLWVSQADYLNCTTTKPIEKYGSGHTVIKLQKSGPHYFISGVEEHCKKNEKVTVVVMADRTKKSPTAPPPAAATVPAPAPYVKQSPPSPPASPPHSDTEVDSAPAPTAEHPPPPPPNGASSSIISVVFSIGAFIGSSLLMVL